ncbi:unannotated protein [freshwater metagenome]|uniref:Unannotated protein n=1 Tax=freshwater metagenome TaxID=449393 RepID=A0A6J6J6W4_9ZZZZ
MKNSQGQDELDRRRHVLHEANNTQRKILRSGAEHDQRHGGHDAEENQPGGTPKTICTKLKTRRSGSNDRTLDGGNREQDARLERITVYRRNLAAKFALGQAIDSERAGEDQSNPWQTAVINSENRHGNCTHCHRSPLELPKTFAKKNHGKQDCDQRVDEVAERALHDMVVGNGDHIDLPVGQDEEA